MSLHDCQLLWRYIRVCMHVNVNSSSSTFSEENMGAMTQKTEEI